MGTTSEKLTYLNTTKNLIKEELNLGGANITNEPFREYKGKLEGIYKDFLANGTDALWNNWLPKVTGTGENITLNNTIETKMNIVYKGNTSQKTTTGKNLFNASYYKDQTVYNETVAIETGNVSCVKLNLKPNTTYTISEALNNWTLAGSFLFAVINTNNQIIRYLQTRPQDYQTNPTTFTTNSEGYVYIGHRYGFSSSDRMITFLNTVNIQIEEGNTATSFEEYTGGASPNPDYPQDIQVVSGDNTIKVEGKNLFDINSCPILEYAFYDGNGNPVSWAGTCGIREYIKLEENLTYTIKYNSSSNFLICFYDKNKTYLSQLTKASGGNFTMPSTAKYIRFGINTAIANVEWCQIEKGSNATEYTSYVSQTYPINIGDIELCKIGTYQDSIKKSSGKNLFDKDSVVGGFVNADGSVGGDTSAYKTSDFIPIQPNTAYYKTSTESPRTKYYDSNKQPLNTTTYQDISIGGNAGTFTTPNNAYYLRFSYPIASVNANGIMINEGTTALPYEPYGKVWYLNKQIGKVVLNGSESSWVENSATKGLFQITLTNVFNNANTINALSNLLRGDTGSNITNSTYSRNNTISTYSSNRLFFKINDYRENIAGLKTYLASHNLIAYYVLATPTYEEITDSTLIYQLEAIKKSYNNQTNISQENSKEAFILDVTALGN